MDLTEDQQKETEDLGDTDVPGKSKLIEHRIILNNEDPIDPNHILHLMLFEKKGEIKDMLELRIIWE